MLNTLKLNRKLPKGWRAAVGRATRDNLVGRIWKRDPSVWTDSGEQDWLGWLDLAEWQAKRVDALEELGYGVEADGLDNVVLLGMGGSSLAPEVIASTLGVSGFAIVDSTDPAQVRSIAERFDPAETMYFVSSKSGSTLEPDILRRYFYELAGDVLGRRAGDHFVAVTDPGSDLEAIASRDGYREIFYGLPSVGGRFSALSAFGMAPAAAVGIDVADFLKRARLMAKASKKRDLEQNPAALLGLYLGLWAEQGRNKVTVLASDGLRSLGAWLEQLLAESTGKQGKAIVPVDLEPLADDLGAYGDDRVFVALELGDDPDFRARVDALSKSQPVVHVGCLTPSDLAQEFYRWEFATAVAGAVMGINPFDQPDVQASKTVTKELTNGYEQTGALAQEQPFYEDDQVRLFAPARYAVELARAARKESAAAYLKAHFARLGAGDYAALLAYLEMNEANVAQLQELRERILSKTGVATCVGFGPRFLHSTGQAYKGGPNTGVFLQITGDAPQDLAVPGKRYTFGVVKTAQARGDFQVLVDRGRRALRVHLLGDPDAGLKRLVGLAKKAI